MPRGQPCKFFDLTRRLLQERLDLRLSDPTPRKVDRYGHFVSPPFTDMRHLLYECRIKFLMENPDLSEPDSESKNLYVDWEKAVNNWCRTKTGVFGYDPALYWRVREELNIWAEGRAVCEGETGPDALLVEKKTRTRITEKCHFMLLCEKLTVSRELLQNLQELGYKVNLVSTRGHSPSDVQEAVIEVAESLSDKEIPGFYILVLHDYDLEGIKIYLTLKERFDQAIDVGVNRELLDYLKSKGGFDERLVSERVRYRNYRSKLRDEIVRGESSYTLEDFDYLQGSPEEGRKGWVGRRIEIDAIHVMWKEQGRPGVEPFIDYIQHQIETHCRYWDLSRVGVEPFELEEPDNHYEGALNQLKWAAQDAYKSKIKEVSAAMNTILNVVREALPDETGFWSLAQEYWVLDHDYEVAFRSLDIDDLQEVKENFKEEMGKEWSEDFEDGLEGINEQITKYEGDVTQAEQDLNQQFSDLQGELDEAKKDDPDLEEFKEELDEIDWGEDELDEIEPPQLIDEVQKVITRLQDYLVELKEEGD